MMNSVNINKLINEALIIDAEEAEAAGALCYMARILVQATMPHSNPKTCVFARTNGNLRLTISGDPNIGLPYGVYPRLLLSWLVTEAVRTKKLELNLGANLSQFMSELGLLPTGGRWGNITRLRDQMKRLFSALITCTYSDGQNWGVRNVMVIEKAEVWWEPSNPKQGSLWQSTVTLGHEFFHEIIDRPIPIDMRAINALKASAMALDLYCWLTYRLSYLKKPTEIPWPLLQNQFGAEYQPTKQGRHKFKTKLLTQLHKIQLIYEDAAKIEVSQAGLLLVPGNSHIKKIT